MKESSTKKNVAFFAISTHLGGAERSLLDYLNNCDKTAMTIVVVLPKKTGPLVDELKKINIEIIYLELPQWLLGVSRKNKVQALIKGPLALFFIPSLLKKMKTLLLDNKIEVVHSTGLKFHILLMLVCRNLKLELYVHLRDIISLPIIKKVFLVFGKAKNIHFIANSIITAESIKPIPSTIIYNGFDDKYFNKTPSQLKQKMGFKESDNFVALIGVIARWKGQREFIEAAKIVLQSLPNTQFLIVGNEIYDTSGEKGELQLLKDRVQMLGIEKNFNFIDFQKNLVPIYSDIDVLVHASIQPEPFGRVIVEAMLCQCAVTASNQGGPLEIIEDGKSGLLHTPSSPQQMAANITSLLDSKEYRHKMATNAQKAAQRFSMDKYCNNMTQTILGAVDHSPKL